jgi:hypothetical protein
MTSRRPARIAASLVGRLRLYPGAERIRALTGVGPAEWREIGAAFPGLPREPGRSAARLRERLAARCRRALASGQWSVRVVGGPLDAAPTVYVGAHLGSLQALRYALRSRGVPVAVGVGPHNLDRTEAARQDRIFDARHPMEFPHALPAARVHRLRSALRSGSLILAADLPERDGAVFPVLGGAVALDPRPFRLARAARVPCRPAFLTLPRGRWTLTLGPVLPADEKGALAGFARCFAETAARSPLDLDGRVYFERTRGRV